MLPTIGSKDANAGRMLRFCRLSHRDASWRWPVPKAIMDNLGLHIYAHDFVDTSTIAAMSLDNIITY